MCGAATTLTAWAGEGGVVDMPQGGLPPGLTAGVPVFSSLLSHNSASWRDPTVFDDGQDLNDQLEILTSMHRRKHAARHIRKGTRVSRSGPDLRPLRPGEKAPPPHEVVARDSETNAPLVHAPSGHAYLSHWHAVRAEGQAKRFEKVRECGRVTRKLEGYDPVLGGDPVKVLDFEQHCGNWRVCQRCARRRRARLSHGILEQRARALATFESRMRRSWRGPEGRWTEKLITLTVPHSGDAGADAKLLRRAWAEMQRRLLTHLKKDRGCEAKPAWVRAVEVAPSDDGGHAHLHLWWVGPFLDNVWLRGTWGRVLESMGVDCPRLEWDEAMKGWRGKDGRWRGMHDQRSRTWLRTRRGAHGRQTASVPWPHVDMRAAGDGEAAAEYATKVGVCLYVVKSDGVRRMHPVHAASVYAALEGVRAVQWARGWAPRRPPSELYWVLRRLTTAERDEWLSRCGDGRSRNANSNRAAGHH